MHLVRAVLLSCAECSRHEPVRCVTQITCSDEHTDVASLRAGEVIVACCVGITRA